MMNAVGGTSMHYWSQSWRLNPWDFTVVSETKRRYGANRIWIKLHTEARELHLRVKDDGRGFQPTGVFAAIGLLMGLLGTPEMAAHEIALNLASLTFMVPQGIGAAAAVRVGRAVGEGDRSAAHERARTALVCGVGFMVCTAAAMLAIPRAIAGAYTNQPLVASIAASLIPIAGMFQLFDGIQAVSAGVLRGLGDTRGPFLINLAGFWLCGFPVSVLLAFGTPLRAMGLWWGLAAGLAVVAALLLLRVRSRLRGALVRMEHVVGAQASPETSGI